MTQEDFYSSIEQPEHLTASVVEGLEQELSEYPYFEAGWMLMLKGMSDLGVTNFDSSLHRGAVSISNRNALYSLIHSKSETAPVETVVESKNDTPEEPKVVSTQQASTQKDTNTSTGAISWSIGDYEYDLTIGTSKPSSNAPYSIDDISKSVSLSDNCDFSDWLDYMDKQPSSKNTARDAEQEAVKTDRRQDTRSRNLSLIESFLNNDNAEIIRKREEPVAKPIVTPKLNEAQQDGDNDDILTETLARIYIKQQQYDKAINIFRKLGLKYPEKSSYFASRINELENK